MASHFEFDGFPDGWSSRVAFFTIYLGALLLAAGALFACWVVLTPARICLRLSRLPGIQSN